MSKIDDEACISGITIGISASPPQMKMSSHSFISPVKLNPVNPLFYSAILHLTSFDLI